MNYFDNLSLKDGNITVLGVDAESFFVKDLYDYLKSIGREDTKVCTPDKDGFTVHTEDEIKAYSESGNIIGVVSAKLFEKRICDTIENYGAFCQISDLAGDELVYQRAIANAVLHDKYDTLFIDDVNSESLRFLARETAKILKSGVDVYMINTDSRFVETLIKQN